MGASTPSVEGTGREWEEPARLSDVLGAEYAARGWFEARGEGYAFVSEEDLWGDAKVLEETLAEGWPGVRPDGEGGLEVSTRSASLGVGDYGRWDAGAPGLWFVGPVTWPRTRILIRQPLELEAGFRALHRGDEPPVRFRVLQALDFDLRWSGLEALFAERDPELIRELHRLGSDWQIEVGYPALDALIQTGTLDHGSLRRAWREAGEHERFPASSLGGEPVGSRGDAWNLERPLPTVVLSRWAVDAVEFESALKLLFAHQVRGLTDIHPRPDASRYAAGRCLLAVDPSAALLRIRSHRGPRFDLRGNPIPHDRVPALRALAYLPHGAAFRLLEAAAFGERIGSDDVSAAIRGLGVQDQPRSLAVLERFMAERGSEYHGAALCEALGWLSDPRALAVLKAEENTLGRRAPLEYARARWTHGDSWGRELVLYDLRGFIGDVVEDSVWGWFRRGTPPVPAVLRCEAPVVTALLRTWVEQTWPIRWDAYFDPPEGWEFRNPCLGFQAGDEPRVGVLAEVARRDPTWLGDLALEHMASDRIRARIQGANVFLALTGRTHGYSPARFASERREPLESLRRWWKANREQDRGAWMASYFLERGYSLETLDDRSAIPTLVDALGGTPTDHVLAVEQISRLVGMEFGPAPPRWSSSFGLSVHEPPTPEEQARNRAHIVAWLEGHGWFEGGTEPK